MHIQTILNHAKQACVHLYTFCTHPSRWVHAGRKVVSFGIFFIILSFFIVEKSYGAICRIPLFGIVARKALPIFKPITSASARLIDLLEKYRPFQVRQSYLVRIAYGNLRARSNRTLITVFGMATGIGIIVYLLSLGYGIERLVIAQVASLDELKMIDVAASHNTALKMNAQTIQKISGIPTVERVLPVISLVGRIDYNKAQTDILAYGADESFLKVARLRLKKGKIFTDSGSGKGITDMSDGNGGTVAGVSETAIATVENAQKNNVRGKGAVHFHIQPSVAAPVWRSCSITSELIGYTARVEAPLIGKLAWGSTYAPYHPFGRSGYDKAHDAYLGEWIYAKVPLYTPDVDDNLIPKIGAGYQEWAYGCIQESRIQRVDALGNPMDQREESSSSTDTSVLGVSSDESAGDADITASDATQSDVEKVLAASSAASEALDEAIAAQGVVATGSAEPAFELEVISTDSAGIEQVRLVASGEAKLQSESQRIPFEGKPVAQAVISSGLMRLLGIQEKDVLSKTFTVSFIVSESLRPDVRGRQMSDSITYTIVGLIEDDNQQYFYVPFSDMQKLGVENFSQLKVTLKNKDGLAKVRTEIETLGYNTTSVTDTVRQIESIFGTLRIVLGTIGLIALAVASLGMFNTLTVSLLERTREIGGMKVIGMVSEEIQDLFLAEAMIMGFSGGIGGLLLGFLFGQLTSILVSVMSIANGLGYLDLAYVPITFVASILVLSFVVGTMTGLYPAKRAREISALNALRYE